VRLDKRRFQPEDRGRLVIAFLSSFFERYVQYNFTADLESQLDDISDGRADWKAVLSQFWDAFHKKIDDTKELSITNVIDALDADLGPHFFPDDPNHPDKNPRACPACADGRLGLKLGRTGGFVGCSNYPDCRFTRALAVPGNGEEDDALAGPIELGADPKTGERVTLRKGPYGIYLQLGEPKGPKGKEKPPRCSLPKGLAPAEVTLETALALLALPRTIGAYPETGEPILAGIGRYGPYVKHLSTYRNIPEGEDVLTIGLNRAVALIAEAPARRGGGASSGKEIGSHPGDGKPVTLHSGRYGPYVKHGRTIASLPKGESDQELSFERALQLLAAKAEKDKAKGGRKAPAAKKAKAPKKAKKAKKAKAKKVTG
jgi:DNA topoisomerase-1